MSNKKNKEIEIKTENVSDSDEELESGSEDDSDVDSEGKFVGDKQFQIDFEGRNPEDCDFHGIKHLLRQIFLKSDVDLGELAQLIISQNYVGSVVKQCLDDVRLDDDDDYDDGSDGVFGITTIINLTKKQNEPCIQQIRILLRTLAEDNADEKTRSLIVHILSNEGGHVGFVVNERILNIPPAISVPLFSSLQSELDKAVSRDMPYSFQYLIWICKTFTIGDSPELMFANQEERPIVDEALGSFDVNVAEDAELTQWDVEGGDMKPFRKVLIFEAKKFNHLASLIKQEVEGA